MTVTTARPMPLVLNLDAWFEANLPDYFAADEAARVWLAQTAADAADTPQVRAAALAGRDAFDREYMTLLEDHVGSARDAGMIPLGGFLAIPHLRDSAIDAAADAAYQALTG